MHPHDTQVRSLVKTVVWRVIATAITLAVVHFFTGELRESTKITLIAAFFSMCAYYLHERAWSRLHWGQKNDEELS